MRTRIATIVAGLVLAAGLAGGVAYATIPAADGTINGCYRTSLDDQKGQLRIVDDPASCRSNEMAIQWSQEGPQGIQGIQGIQGVQGETGATGAQGPKGDTGDTGAAGTNGTNGVDGEDGQPGTDGTDGRDGTNGVDGEDGQPGTNGTNGIDGTNGVDGDDGVSVTSTPEAAGANCANGGSKFTAANGTTYACNGASGPQGPAGPGGLKVSTLSVDGSGFKLSGTIGVARTGTGTYALTFPAGHSGLGVFFVQPSFPSFQATTTCAWVDGLNAAGTTVECRRKSDGVLVDTSLHVLLAG